MPAVHDQPLNHVSHGVEIDSIDAHRPPTQPDAELRHSQAATHLLRELEARRLPEALALRDQVRDGEPLRAEDHACLAELMRMLDQAADLLSDHPDLVRARHATARLCDEILTQAHVAQQGDAPAGLGGV